MIAEGEEKRAEIACGYGRDLRLTRPISALSGTREIGRESGTSIRRAPGFRGEAG